jgi:MFS family permease
MRQAFSGLFSAKYLRRTVIMSVLFLVSIIGLWAGSIYVPTAVTQIALRQGYAAADAARLASYGIGVLSIGTILGCIALPAIAERLGRRPTMGLYFGVMAASIAVAFGYVFYLPKALPLFFAMVFLLGVGGANFAMYTLWIPEQYTTECRGSAIGFTSSIGRFVGCGMVFLVGAGVASYGSLGVPVALTALAFAVGLLVLPFADETRGKPLPM